MAKKIIIENGNAIVVIDTDSGKRLLSEPIKSIWYNEEMLQKGVVQFTNIDPEDTQHLLSVSLSDCLDSTDSFFTEESFRTFAQSNLGNSSAGSSASSTSIGFIDYNDNTGEIDLITDTWTDVPNNGAGAFTNKSYAPSGINELLNVLTLKLNLT